jgi:hypothetical protein
MRLELLHAVVRTVLKRIQCAMAREYLGLTWKTSVDYSKANRRLQQVRLDLAPPWGDCRIGRVCDVIAPWAKLEGEEDFPGVLGGLVRAGSGCTLGLDQVAVVMRAQQVQNPATPALIDMSGPAAALTAFSRTHNVIVSALPAAGVDRQEYLGAIRLTGLKAAVSLVGAVPIESYRLMLE